MWIEAADLLPPAGVDVLVFAAELDAIAIASIEADGDELHWQTDSDTLAASPLSAVTHWMAIPEPPR